jgi:trans-aconitate methyltransferase
MSAAGTRDPAQYDHDAVLRRWRASLAPGGQLALQVEWVQGTSLTRFRTLLQGRDFERFVAEYRRRLLEVIGDRSPYFYAFKRILLWGRVPAS